MLARWFFDYWTILNGYPDAGSLVYWLSWTTFYDSQLKAVSSKWSAIRCSPELPCISLLFLPCRLPPSKESSRKLLISALCGFFGAHLPEYWFLQSVWLWPVSRRPRSRATLEAEHNTRSTDSTADGKGTSFSATFRIYVILLWEPRWSLLAHDHRDL